MTLNHEPKSRIARINGSQIIFSIVVVIMILFTAGKFICHFITNSLYDSKDLHQMVRESDEFLEKGQYDRAISGYKTALFYDKSDGIKSKPVAPYAYEGLLSCYIKKGDKANIKKNLILYASSCIHDYQLMGLMEGEKREDRTEFVLSLEDID